MYPDVPCMTSWVELTGNLRLMLLPAGTSIRTLGRMNLGGDFLTCSRIALESQSLEEFWQQLEGKLETPVRPCYRIKGQGGQTFAPILYQHGAWSQSRDGKATTSSATNGPLFWATSASMKWLPASSVPTGRRIKRPKPLPSTLQSSHQHTQDQH